MRVLTHDRAGGLADARNAGLAAAQGRYVTFLDGDDWLAPGYYEQLLGAKVESIRTSISHGKIKRQGRFAGRRSDWKKAYVKLREGAKMPEFLEGA